LLEKVPLTAVNAEDRDKVVPVIPVALKVPLAVTFPLVFHEIPPLDSIAGVIAPGATATADQEFPMYTLSVLVLVSSHTEDPSVGTPLLVA
jgi:hypothetical protein